MFGVERSASLISSVIITPHYLATVGKIVQPEIRKGKHTNLVCPSFWNFLNIQNIFANLRYLQLEASIKSLVFLWYLNTISQP